MVKDYQRVRWIAFASSTYFTRVEVVKGYVEISGDSAFIRGHCVPVDKVWDTEEEAQKEALLLIEARMKKLLKDIEVLEIHAKRIMGEM